jgi:two-component system chemotaxis response regulator CheB
MSSSQKIRVLVVDDSAVVRQILTRELAKTPDIDVVGTAPDPYVARERVVELKPQVITLDVEMPRMDGITFLRALMKHYPIPTIVCSSLTPKGSQTAIDAMQAGAVEVLCKPNGSFSIESLVSTLAEKIRVAARSKVLQKTDSPPTRATYALSETTNKVLAIGASTGGVQALTEVLTRFPRNAPGTVIVQHMPAKFTGSFAERLNKECDVEVKEAVKGDRVIPGRVLIAPGGFHMVLRRSGADYYVDIIDGAPVHHQKPAVDILFDSVAQYAGANAVGAVLTGMGADGAAGLLKMKQAGARTLAQDEASCVVFGMPMEAIKLGAADRIVSLSQVAQTMLQLASGSARAAA